MTAQIPLGISPRQDHTFENYYPGANQQAIEVLLRKTEPCCFLWSSTPAGVSHLLQASCDDQSVYIPFKSINEYTPELFVGLERFHLIALDDLQYLAVHGQWQEALFHLINRTKLSGGRMIFGANGPVKNLGFSLPDLKSRLLCGIEFHIQPLADEEKAIALALEFQRRGLVVAEECVNYILARSSRDMDDLRSLVQQLDQASLASKRAVTIPLIKEVTQW